MAPCFFREKNSSVGSPAEAVGCRADVAPGEGALYRTPNGWVAVVINGGNAAEAIGVTTGDGVVLAKEGEVK